MTTINQPSYNDGRLPKHPGGLSSLGMAMQDTRFPLPPPQDWDQWDEGQRQAWAAEHFTPDEWRTARRKVQDALIALINFFPFYGVIFSKMAEKQVWITDPKQEQSMPGGDKFRTMATDGHVLYIWPGCPLYFTLWETMAVMLHELMHNISLHPQRARGWDPVLANIALDYVTNLMVNDAALVAVGLDPKHHVMGPDVYERVPWAMVKEELRVDPQDPSKTTHWFIDEKWRTVKGEPMTVEEVYHQLLEEMPPCPRCGQSGCGGSLVSDHSIWTPGNRPGDEHGEVHQGQITAQRIRDIVTDAYIQLQGEKGMGYLPAGLKRQVDRWINPPLPWYTMLSAWMKMAPYDYSWSPGDVRFPNSDPMPWIYDQPDLSYATFGFDLSGSMSDTEIAASVANALAILRCFPAMKGYGLFWDADVHEVFPLEDFSGTINREGISGGGGTRIKPQFDKITEMGIKDKVAVHVCFTDGYVPWSEVDPDELPYDVLWVITNDSETPPQHYRYKVARLHTE